MIRLHPSARTKPTTGNRRAHDFYPTPPAAIASLLDACPPATWDVLEPAAGDGAIVCPLLECGHTVHAVELRQECYGTLSALTPHVVIGDWLELSRFADAWPRPLSVMTNPPFSIAREFAEACLSIGAEYVALLLRVNVEASNPWRSFWKAHPWTDRVVLWKRPSFTGHGTDMTNYAWFVWRSSVRGG